MEKIAGFNVGKASYFKFVKVGPNVGGKRAHYVSTHLKNHVVEIYPGDNYDSVPMKVIYNKAQASKRLRFDDAIFMTKLPKEGMQVLEITPRKVIKQAKEAIKKLPKEVQKIITIDPNKWIMR